MKRKNKQQSIISIINWIMIPTCCVLLVLFLVIAGNLKKVQEATGEYMMNTATLFVNNLDANVDKMTSEIYWRCEERSYFDGWPEEISVRNVDFEVINEILADNTALKTRYGKATQFFLYYQAGDFLVADSAVYYPGGFEIPFIGELRAILQEPWSAEWKWELFYMDGSPWLLSAYRYKSGISGYCIDLELLLKGLEINNMGYRLIPAVLWQDQERILSGTYAEDGAIRELFASGGESKGFLNNMVSTFSITRDMDIEVLMIPEDGILHGIVNMQLVLLSIVAGVLLVVGYGFGYLYLRLYRPLRQFMMRLQDPEVELLLDTASPYSLVELELFNKELNDLLERIKNLRIVAYEREVKENQVRMEYVKEQLQSHFYLNCLSILHNMAVQDEDERMARFLKILSRYIRYVGNEFDGMKPLREELAHINDYIEIQQIRYGGAFSYEADVADDLVNCQVPAMILQIFVDNAVKHGVNLTKELNISLYITKETIEEEECLYITISDNGKGFSEEILDAIREDQPIYYGGRKHVGISNTKQRLAMIYGDKAGLKLFNMPGGYGAVVELVLPIREG